MRVRKLRHGLAWCWGVGPRPASIRIAQIMLERYPEQRAYAETFATSPAMIYAKLPYPLESANDVSSGYRSFYRVLRDPLLREQFYAVQQECEQRIKWGTSERPRLPYPLGWIPADLPLDEAKVARACQWYYVARMSFLGDSVKLLSNVLKKRPGLVMGDSIFESGDTEDVPELSFVEFRPNFNKVQVDNWGWQGFIRRFDYPGTLHFAAPDAYFGQRRAIAGRYARELVDLFLKVQGGAVLFGKERAPYARLLAAGWERQEIWWRPPYEIPRRAFRAYRVGRSLFERRHRAPRMYLWMSPHPRVDGE